MSSVRFTISALADNVPGVLQRLSIVFTRRKINIESMTVSETHAPGISRFTFVIKADPDVTAKVLAQMRKVVELHEVAARRDEDVIYREIALVQVRTAGESRSDDLDNLVAELGARICGAGSEGVVIELVGGEEEIDSGVAALRRFGVEELVRSGRIAVARVASE